MGRKALESLGEKARLHLEQWKAVLKLDRQFGSDERIARDVAYIQGYLRAMYDMGRITEREHKILLVTFIV